VNNLRSPFQLGRVLANTVPRLRDYVVEQRRSKLAPQHSQVGYALLELAAIELRAGELEPADVHVREAEAILRAVLEPNHPDLVAVLRTRGDIERAALEN
jgi:hypothetical protein